MLHSLKHALCPRKSLIYRLNKGVLYLITLFTCFSLVYYMYFARLEQQQLSHMSTVRVHDHPLPTISLCASSAKQLDSFHFSCRQIWEWDSRPYDILNLESSHCTSSARYSYRGCVRINTQSKMGRNRFKILMKVQPKSDSSLPPPLFVNVHGPNIHLPFFSHKHGARIKFHKIHDMHEFLVNVQVERHETDPALGCKTAADISRCIRKNSCFNLTASSSSSQSEQSEQCTEACLTRDRPACSRWLIHMTVKQLFRNLTVRGLQGSGTARFVTIQHDPASHLVFITRTISLQVTVLNQVALFGGIITACFSVSLLGLASKLTGIANRIGRHELQDATHAATEQKKSYPDPKVFFFRDIVRLAQIRRRKHQSNKSLTNVKIAAYAVVMFIILIALFFISYYTERHERALLHTTVDPNARVQVPQIRLCFSEHPACNETRTFKVHACGLYTSRNNNTDQLSMKFPCDRRKLLTLPVTKTISFYSRLGLLNYCQVIKLRNSAADRRPPFIETAKAAKSVVFFDASIKGVHERTPTGLCKTSHFGISIALFNRTVTSIEPDDSAIFTLFAIVQPQLTIHHIMLRPDIRIERFILADRCDPILAEQSQKNESRCWRSCLQQQARSQVKYCRHRCYNKVLSCDQYLFHNQGLTDLYSGEKDNVRYPTKDLRISMNMTFAASLLIQHKELRYRLPPLVRMLNIFGWLGFFLSLTFYEICIIIVYFGNELLRLLWSKTIGLNPADVNTFSKLARAASEKQMHQHSSEGTKQLAKHGSLHNLYINFRMTSDLPRPKLLIKCSYVIALLVVIAGLSMTALHLQAGSSNYWENKLSIRIVITREQSLPLPNVVHCFSPDHIEDETLTGTPVVARTMFGSSTIRVLTSRPALIIRQTDDPSGRTTRLLALNCSVFSAVQQIPGTYNGIYYLVRKDLRSGHFYFVETEERPTVLSTAYMVEPAFYTKYVLRHNIVQRRESECDRAYDSSNSTERQDRLVSIVHQCYVKCLDLDKRATTQRVHLDSLDACQRRCELHYTEHFEKVCTLRIPLTIVHLNIMHHNERQDELTFYDPNYIRAVTVSYSSFKVVNYIQITNELTLYEWIGILLGALDLYLGLDLAALLIWGQKLLVLSVKLSKRLRRGFDSSRRGNVNSDDTRRPSFRRVSIE